MGMPSSQSKSQNPKKGTRTQHVQDKNPTIFCCNNKTKIEQSYNKKTYSKLILNRLEVLPLCISFGDLTQLNLHKTSSPFLAHDHPCVDNSCGP
jgi:hypothetical protein